MPKYIQPIKIGKKRHYAVFSTITMSFHSSLYPDLKSIKKRYPQLRVHRKTLKGRKLKNGLVEITQKVIRIQPTYWATIKEKHVEKIPPRKYLEEELRLFKKRFRPLAKLP